jgi:photosystem II stability/assembly factor-like uncharacterized protein
VGNASRGNWEIYTTSDGGAGWTRVPGAYIPKPLSGEQAIEDHPGTANGADDSFWFTTYQGSVYGTSDCGKTWHVTRSVLSGSVACGVAFKDNLNGIACSFIESNKVSTTSDGGNTWQPVQLKFSSPSTMAVIYISGTDNSYLINARNHALQQKLCRHLLLQFSRIPDYYLP